MLRTTGTSDRLAPPADVFGADRTATPGGASERTMKATEVCTVIQHLDVDTARSHHVELTAVLAELASDAQVPWPWTHDDPTVALLRALARLALVAPDAVSERAGALCDRVASPARPSTMSSRREVMS